MQRNYLAVALIWLTSVAAPAAAQLVPWDTFTDSPVSGSICSVVNAGNTELVVLRDTGQMVIVTGTDVTLGDVVVDLDGFVTFGGEPAGLLDFAVDGDEFRTLWWLTLTGNVVEIDGFTGQPEATDLFPTDFEHVPCDACDLWDDPGVCAEEPPTVNLCGTDVPLAASASFVGLLTFGRLRRSRRKTR